MNKSGFFYLRIFPLMFMLLVTIVCISVVVGLHLSTRERVEVNEDLFLRRTVLDAADISYPNDFREIDSLYEEMVTEDEDSGSIFYRIMQSDGSLSYVVPAEGPGLWGQIMVMVGFAEDLVELTGIGIFSQNETPGLGARIEEEWFQDQFAGKRGPFTLVEEGTADSPNEIDGITGATKTSRAMISIMNRAVIDGPALVRGE
jgi:Na+-transporting NADH:ubiquinone oxidoreductase subunit C